MKKVLGFILLIVLEVLIILMLINRCESIDKNVNKGSNCIELFAKK